MNNESSPLLLSSLETHQNGSQNKNDNDVDCSDTPTKHHDHYVSSLEQIERGYSSNVNDELEGSLRINVRESFDDENNVEIKLYQNSSTRSSNSNSESDTNRRTFINHNNTEEERQKHQTNKYDDLLMKENDTTYRPLLPQEHNIQILHTKDLNRQKHKDKDQQHSEEIKVTYLSIVRSNKPLQLFLSSYIITQIGEWFTYVASIELIEQILGPEKASSSRRYISYLVVFRLLPFLFITPFGGVLADIRDRRKSMIVLDWIGAIAPLLFLIGAYFQSISIVYIVTAMQSTIAALYEPCRNSIIPLLAPGEEEMQKATTLAGLVWSVMAAFGAATGGFMVSIVGIRACFVLDSFSFICSALILVLMEGDWDASSNSTNEAKENLSILHLVYDMIIGGVQYIRSSTFWPLVFMKVTASIIYGGADVLNVSFSEMNIYNESGELSSDQNQAENSRRLGALFFSVGFGCYIGPIIADNWSSMKNMNTILNACVVAFAIQGIGLLGMSYFFDPFYYPCLFTVIRSAGSSIAWIDSSILLQSYSKPDMLGRVMAVDYGMALTGESLSALIVGILQDKMGMSAMEVSSLMGYIAIFMFGLWLAYRLHEPKLN